MRARFVSIVLATTLLSMVADVARAQNLERDLPWQRVEPALAPERCLALGLDQLRAGWNWEAARSFRELVAQDGKQPLGHLLLAVAMRDQPNRSARLCWDAVARMAEAPADQRAVIAAYQTYFGVTQQPELVDARFQVAPPRERADALVRELGRLAVARFGNQLATGMMAVEASLRSEVQPMERRFVASTLASYHVYLAQTGSMPFLVPGYRELLTRHLADANDREQQLARLPRHPQLGVGEVVPVGPLPGFTPSGDAAGAETWQPQKASGFDLPRGLGGRGKSADYRGKPFLAVFFLGFG